MTDVKKMVEEMTKRIETHEKALCILKERYELETKVICAIFEAAVSGDIREHNIKPKEQ